MSVKNKTSYSNYEDAGITIGKNISKNRKKRDLTQRKLARLLYLEESSICNYESGKSEPRIPTLMKMCEVFHITMDQMVGFDISDKMVIIDPVEQKIVGFVLDFFREYKDEIVEIFISTNDK